MRAVVVMLLGLLAWAVPNARALDVPSPGKKAESQGVVWTPQEKELVLAPGATVSVHIKGEIPAHWHTYSTKTYKIGPSTTVFSLGADSPVVIAGPITSDPAPKIDEKATKLFGEEVEIFEESVTFIVPLKLKGDQAVDAADIKLSVNYQMCTDGYKPDDGTKAVRGQCKNPITIELPIALKKKVSAAETLPVTSSITMTKPLHLSGQKAPLEWAPANCTDLSVRPGAIFEIKVRGIIENGYHTFSMKKTCDFMMPTSFALEPADMFTLAGAPEADRPPKQIDVPVCTNKVDVYENAVTFTIPVKLSEKALEGKTELKVHVTSQVCSEKCQEIKPTLTMPVTISSTAQIVMCPTEVKPLETPAPKRESFWAFLLTAATAGLLSLLTPCVFPMIPITVSFFTKRQHISHARAVRDAFIFSTGIVLTYVGLGFFFALVLGQNIRDFVTNPWTNLAIFTIFVVMAFNLFGFFEIQIPTGLVNRLNQKAHGGNSILALLLMGLVFTMTSFTCTGPFVGTVMIWAVRGEWAWPLAGMIVFATVFSAPFFFLALFPAALKSLPKSGGWMNSVKVVMGFVELAAALKFLSNADLTFYWQALTHELFVGIWLLLSLATVAYLFGFYKFPHDSKLKRVGPVRIAVAFIFMTAAVFLFSDLIGYSSLGFASSFPPPRPYPDKLTEDWESGLAAGRKAGKPVFFDFTGVTCQNCRQMETEMFTRKDIRALMEKYVVIRLYTDVKNTKEDADRSARNAKNERDLYGYDTLPFYAIVTPEGNKIAEFGDGYTTDVAAFSDFLNVDVDDFNNGLRAASAAKKPALFAFHGPPGTMCPTMEQNVFGHPDVKSLIQNFFEVKLPVPAPDSKEVSTRAEHNLKVERERFKAEAMPFFVIVSPNDQRELARFDDGCTDDPKKFIEFLKKGLPAQATVNGLAPVVFTPAASAEVVPVSFTTTTRRAQ